VPPAAERVAPSPQRANETENTDEATSGPASAAGTPEANSANVIGSDDLVSPTWTALPHLAPPSFWASAISPNAKYKLEARAGRKTTLVHAAADWRLDLSSHKIVCASYSPDSQTLATGHDDSIVRIWDCETGGISASLRGSESAITSVAFAPDGRRIAAGTANGDVHVWDWMSRDEVARLQRQQPGGISCIRWSNRGDRLAVALGNWSDGEVTPLVIWSPEEGAVPAQELLLDKPAGAIQWLADDTALLVAAWDGEACVWKLATREPVDWLSLKKDTISAAAWSPDCPLISRWQADRLAALGNEP
jgi:WD40 repeat protein